MSYNVLFFISGILKMSTYRKTKPKIKPTKQQDSTMQGKQDPWIWTDPITPVKSKKTKTSVN